MDLLGLRILIVDDERPDLPAKLLDIRGAEAWPVTSLAEARRIIVAEGGAFDCVVIDLLLLNGNGMDLIRELRLTNPELPCVLLTGVDLAIVTRLEGFDGEYVSKPCSAEVLAEAILRAIRAYAKTDPSELGPDSEPPSDSGPPD